MTIYDDLDEQHYANELEAEGYYIKAQFILDGVQANLQVFGSNSASPTPENVGIALQYINRSLEYFPNNPAYLNLKALLLWEGYGNMKAARLLLQRANQLNPRDIDIANNLQSINAGMCFVATAAYGSPLAFEVNALRVWRDTVLVESRPGRLFVLFYNRVGPTLASQIEHRPRCRALCRILLRPVVLVILYSTSRKALATPPL